LNAFATADISSISASTLSACDVVILAEAPLTSVQVSMFRSWVNDGGNLIAMRPSKQLASLLGLSDTSSTLTNAYLLVNTVSGPGVGIVNERIQFHGVADLYRLNGATTIATLFSDVSTATPYPAVTLARVGASGGQAAAFTYDLARSIVYTRQGNPAWSGHERDGVPPIRPNDLFFGAAEFDPQPDWIDLSKVGVAQADEQQRLLVNLILAMNSRKKPLPRFWYFPNGKKAVIVMTGDDHGFGGTAGRFDIYRARSALGCSAAKWECLRSTSYIVTGTALSDAQAAAYHAEGFEVALHVSTNCEDVTPSVLESTYASQLRDFQVKYSSLPAPSTVRTHCGPWSGYANQPQVEVNHGIRVDTNYYYWPGSWIANRPGMFTGSGMPMRFADANGRIIDVYQATTQMTDESQQAYPFTVNTLLDNALGPAGFYGAFTVNAHTDSSSSDVSDAVVDAALARGVPIVSSRQMLTWLDARNGSTFGGLTWDGLNLTFTITVGDGASGLLEAMVPTSSPAGTLQQITRNATPIAFTVQTIKGMAYAFFPALAGAYLARVTAAPGLRDQRLRE
jgi:hypothetical protein